MLESAGALDLRITRLELQLSVLDSQVRLSLNEPEHLAKLTAKRAKVQSELSELRRQHQALSKSSIHHS